MKHPLAMHVVEFETLDQRAVDQHRMRRGKPPVAAPDPTARGAVQFRKRLDEDLAPFEMDTEDRAAERIENQQLDAIFHLAGNAFIAKTSHEIGDAGCVRVRAGLILAHCILLTRSRSAPKVGCDADADAWFRAQRSSATQAAATTRSGAAIK